MNIMSFHVLSQRPYGISVKSSGQGIEAVLGLVFFKICCSPHPPEAGVIPMQFQVRLMTALIWYFGPIWYTSPHLISMWHFGQRPLVVQWAGEEVWSGWWDLGWRSWILHSSQHSLASPHLLSLGRREGTMKSTEIWGDLFLRSYNQKYSCLKLNLKARFNYCSEQWIDISSRSVLSCCSLRTWGIFSVWCLPSSVAQGPCFLHMYSSEMCLEVLLVWVVKEK